MDKAITIIAYAVFPLVFWVLLGVHAQAWELNIITDKQFGMIIIATGFTTVLFWLCAIPKDKMWMALPFAFYAGALTRYYVF